MSPSGRSETPGDSRPEDDGHILAGEIKVQRRGDFESAPDIESVLGTDAYQEFFATVVGFELDARRGKKF